MFVCQCSGVACTSGAYIGNDRWGVFVLFWLFFITTLGRSVCYQPIEFDRSFCFSQWNSIVLFFISK